ncbi:MAG: lipid-A-disaccharide synthase N-terminal domain-containing protein [Desulfobacterota bacterium]|nr:lipid-A-disaccharide synthase N-terminal domain-containing protein [Thermodesulfobacteriota bacterium]
MLSLKGWELFWVLFGFLGQAAFSARFLVQWIVSERKRESVVPVSFWYLSLIGGLILFLYAIYKRDPVFIVGQGSGVIVYIRNLVLIYRKQRGCSGAFSASS